MPHRISQKKDIGNAKVASDSYDIDNIYLTEEGWVYRHFKNNEKTLWWDEIIVAGQVKPGMTVHGVSNDVVVETNPLKLGTQGAVTFETGDAVQDMEYAGQPGHSTDYTNTVIDPADKIYAPGDSYRVYDAVQGVPDGWTGVSDPSNEEGYPDEPTKESPFYPGEDYQSVNEYTIAVEPLPAPYGGADPYEVIVGEFESGAGGGTAGEGGVVPPAPPAPTLGTVTVNGSADVASASTGTYTGSIDGTATDATFVVSADGGATVSGNDVTFPAGPATVTVTVTATSATASDSPATGTLSVNVNA